MRETGKREGADSQEHQYPVGHRPVRDGEVTVTSFVSHVTFVSQSSVGSGAGCAFGPPFRAHATGVCQLRART